MLSRSGINRQGGRYCFNFGHARLSDALFAFLTMLSCINIPAVFRLLYLEPSEFYVVKSHGLVDRCVNLTCGTFLLGGNANAATVWQ
jgi:hypothetical protein